MAPVLLNGLHRVKREMTPNGSELFDSGSIWTQEWKMRYPTDEREFSPSTIPAYAPLVPQQCNGCDCGVFVLHFAELFAKRPFVDLRYVWKLIAVAM